MEKRDAITALAALAQETRLDIFRLLVQAGAPGLPAGKIGEVLSLPSATLAFHLKELKHSGLITFTRAGRSLIYQAVYPMMGELLAYLTENCCKGVPLARDRRGTPSEPASEASRRHHPSTRAVAAPPAHR